jgi:ABC-type multidrug transport system ATPase subunit
MNELMLKELMRLFAIVSNIKEDESVIKRNIVMDYLDKQYSYEIVLKYINFFDEQVRYFQQLNIDSIRTDNTLQQTKAEQLIIELCGQINEELDHEQKIILLLFLLDFIQSGQKINPNELSLVGIVASSLKVTRDEYSDAKAFTSKEIEKINKECLLFIRPMDSECLPHIKQIALDKLDSEIIVLRIASANIYVMRYYGKMVLMMNGQRMEPGRSYMWPVGGVLRNPLIGSFYYTWVSRQFIQAGLENKFVFTAEDIEFGYLNSKNGVKKFSLNEESGRLVGIIGGSGSGKSTLLNVLNGNLKPKAGSIRINGWNIHDNKERVKGIIGYVPQDDLLIKELSVYENLYFNTRLCSSDNEEEQIHALIEEVLLDFDLLEARDLKVGDAYTTILSGGQRKRLNIALELIREPSILLVDEPTSGLSSADSENVISLLKKQTIKGKLVIANIHQPSSDVFKMFDKLLVMDQGGRVIYYGHPIGAITYFKQAAHYADAEETECLSCGNINADEILRIVESREVDANGRLTRQRKMSPELWYQRFLKNIDVKTKLIEREHDSSIPKSNFKTPDHFEQFTIYLKRDLLAKYYNKQYIVIVALEAPILAFILAFFSKNFNFVNGIPRYVFSENAGLPAFLFMAVIVALFLGLVISAEEIFKDRKILKREKFLHLSRSSYLLSKISILFMISAVQTLIFVLIANSMLEIKGMLFPCWFVLFTASCWSNLVGLNISSGFKSVVTIYILVPLILVPQLLFSGVIIDFSKMHHTIANEKEVPIIGDNMASRWAYEALAVNQYKNNRYTRYFYDAESKARNAGYYRSYAIPGLVEIANDTRDLYYNRVDSLRYLNNLKLLRSEMDKIIRDIGSRRPPFMDSISHPFYRPALNAGITAFLDRAGIIYRNRYNRAVGERDSIYHQLVSELGGKDQVMAFRQKYDNRQLATVVTQEKEIQHYILRDGEMISKKNAVYREPLNNNGRAHFYAPVKRISNLKVDTFWFNMALTWIFNLLSLIFLYSDAIRRILDYFETIRLNRLNRLKLDRLMKIT